ncbi:hypothetical protein WR25_12934 [Diploscapter pachys]|uniref:Uncharacterized protein n=1 Tax=Diploscapter pachys TaxID=2018661 RepID=A0A2A2LXI4_9BILA|nr:hypothetical protein WR25_12934 [Diploscapter pachys]
MKYSSLNPSTSLTVSNSGRVDELCPISRSAKSILPSPKMKQFGRAVPERNDILVERRKADRPTAMMLCMAWTLGLHLARPSLLSGMLNLIAMNMNLRRDGDAASDGELDCAVIGRVDEQGHERLGRGIHCCHTRETTACKQKVDIDNGVVLLETRAVFELATPHIVDRQIPARKRRHKAGLLSCKGNWSIQQ